LEEGRGREAKRPVDRSSLEVSDDQGDYNNGSDAVFHALAAYISPADAVPPPP
jgi:hypothetical protein